MTIRLHKGDLPANANFGPVVAIDTETLGLNPHRDRLCLVQLSGGDGSADLVQIPAGSSDAPNLKRLLGDPDVLKLFHFGRFDLAVLSHRLGVMPGRSIAPRSRRSWCGPIPTGTGSRTSTRELLGVDLSKQQQSSDWGAETLTEAQLAYAASDVLYLHALKDKLDANLAREGRTDVAQAAFAFLPWRAKLDLMGWAETDIFAHA